MKYARGLQSLTILGWLNVLACSNVSNPAAERGPVDASAADAATSDGSVLDASFAGAPSADASSVPRICDGSATLRLRVFIEPQIARNFRGSAVRVENGYPSLFVDGTCTYWMGGWDPNDAFARDRPWVRGKIGAELVQSFESTFNGGQLDALNDCVTGAAMSDSPYRQLSSESSMIRCKGKGAKFDAAWDWIASRAPTFADEGEPLLGALRVSAIEATENQPGKSPPYAWPIPSVDLSSLLLAPTESPDGPQFSPGVSQLVVAEAAVPLRDLLQRYIKDRTLAPGLFGDGLLVKDGDVVAYVYARDELPYSDEQGLLPWTSPQP